MDVDYKMNSKRASQNNQKRQQQSYNYATQIIEASDRSPQSLVKGQNRGGYGHRKNLPVPIDTFNIVSNRRKSLVK